MLVETYQYLSMTIYGVAVVLFFIVNSHPVVKRIHRGYHRSTLIVRTARIGLALAAGFGLIGAVTQYGMWDYAAIMAILVCTFLFSGLLLTQRIKMQEQKRKASVLILAAHPDDLEIACGGTIATLIDRGHDVHAVIMSNGAKGGDASVRPGEAKRAGRFLGMDSIEVNDFPDLNLASVTNDMIGVIERHIKQRDPDLILTHSEHDIHQDHYAVHQAVLRAARNHHSILCFESPSVTKDFTPSVFIDVSEYADVKNTAVNAHANQMSKPYMTRDIIDGITSFRGRQARINRAEGFEPVRLRLDDPLNL